MDPTRVNEFGTSGESDSPPIEGEAKPRTEAIADNPENSAEAITHKSKTDKKDDYHRSSHSSRGAQIQQQGCTNTCL